MNTKNKQRARLALTELEKEMEVLTKEQMNACKGGNNGSIGNSGYFAYNGSSGMYNFPNQYPQSTNYPDGSTGDNQTPCEPWDSNCDGKLSLREANNWYKNGKGQSIVVNASAVDLKFLNSSNFQIGEEKSVQTLYSSDTGLIYGKIRVRYEGDNKFSICDDIYDFNQEAGWSFRNFATKIGEIVAGKGEGYTIHFEGTTEGSSGFNYTEWTLKTGGYR